MDFLRNVGFEGIHRLSIQNAGEPGEWSGDTEVREEGSLERRWDRRWS